MKLEAPPSSRYSLFAHFETLVHKSIIKAKRKIYIRIRDESSFE